MILDPHICHLDLQPYKKESDGSLLLQLSLSTMLEGDETQNGEDSLRFYNNQHNYYLGIVLHVRLLYVCNLDSLGNSLHSSTIAT